MRSHVRIGRSVVTGSDSFESRLPTGLPFRCYGVLEAPRTRRASPLLAGYPPRLLPARAIQLPDKEFRYLGTVIVTAAVYWRLGSKRRPKANLSPSRSSTVQAAAPIRRLTTSQGPVFLVNNRLGLFPAAPSSSTREGLHSTGASLLPKLRDHFAEFLNEGSSDRLGILYLPTCVGFGTGTSNLPRRFSRRHGFRNFAFVGLGVPSQA